MTDFHMLLQTRSPSFSMVPVHWSYLDGLSLLWMPLGISHHWMMAGEQREEGGMVGIFIPLASFLEFTCFPYNKRKYSLKLNLKLLWVPATNSTLYLISSSQRWKQFYLAFLYIPLTKDVNHPLINYFKWSSFHSLLLFSGILRVIYVHNHAWNTLWVPAKSLQSCPTLCDPMDCSLPGFPVHGILQARVLEWVVMPFSSVSSLPQDRTHIY